MPCCGQPLGVVIGVIITIDGNTVYVTQLPPKIHTWHHIVIVGCIRFISSTSLCTMFFFEDYFVKRRSNDASSVSCSICLVNLTTFLRHIGWKLPCGPCVCWLDMTWSSLFSMAKSWQSHAKFPSRISWNQPQNHQQNPLYPLVNVYITIENHHC